MERYLVDIYLLSEAFGGDRIWNFDIKPADGATIVTYFGIFQVDYWVKLRDKDGKWIGGKDILTPVYRVGPWMTTRLKSLSERKMNRFQFQNVHHMVSPIHLLLLPVTNSQQNNGTL